MKLMDQSVLSAPDLERNPLRNLKHPDPFNIYITIQEASSLSHVGASTFLKTLYKGLIHSPDPLPQPEPKYKKNQEELKKIYNSIHVPLSALQPFASMNYWKTSMSSMEQEKTSPDKKKKWAGGTQTKHK